MCYQLCDQSIRFSDVCSKIINHICHRTSAYCTQGRVYLLHLLEYWLLNNGQRNSACHMDKRKSSSRLHLADDHWSVLPFFSQSVGPLAQLQRFSRYLRDTPGWLASHNEFVRWQMSTAQPHVWNPQQQQNVVQQRFFHFEGCKLLCCNPSDSGSNRHIYLHIHVCVWLVDIEKLKALAASISYNKQLIATKFTSKRVESERLGGCKCRGPTTEQSCQSSRVNASRITWMTVQTADLITVQAISLPRQNKALLDHVPLSLCCCKSEITDFLIWSVHRDTAQKGMFSYIHLYSERERESENTYRGYNRVCMLWYSTQGNCIVLPFGDGPFLQLIKV